MKYLAGIMLLCAAVGMAKTGYAAPQKVVSLNLCTDQVAASMLDKSQLKGLSFNASDPVLSLVSGTASDYPALKGTAEEMAEIQPDMVLMAAGQNPQLQQWLETKKVPFFAIEHASSINALQRQISQLAVKLGHPGYAVNLRARQNSLLQHAKLPAANMGVAIYYPRGFTDGRGTLIHDVITRMGGRNLAAEQGKEGSEYLSLEKLISLKPDVLIIPLYDYDVVSQAEKLSQHPALKNIKAQIVPLPGQYLTCPHLGLEAIVNTIAATVREKQRMVQVTQHKATP
ncbi:MAG: ABC transporter substrate-binding protein [Alphaproteobacteria bacterium]|nr:ABC transporter substrate-binding protein [Alphaproteobacteria bacterium]